ncbi:MAG: D-amino-acid transaminase [Alphaproteobacteria bacterium]|nr:D-amino-acid transaminase [Alphaproteobacteria bacterium]
MARISYVNGAYLLHSEAMVHIEDRGYQFADGIYEYFAFYNRTLLDASLHFKRLERSLRELQIAPPMSMAALAIVIRELIDRNGRDDGGVYLQVTRGVARRDHPFPKHTKPALSITVCGPKTPKPQEIKNGVQAITHPDHRWYRRDIKSVSLLANVIAKQEASKHGVREAWLVMEDDKVSEGSVSNAYIVGAKNEIVTHPADTHILGGVTRDVVLKLARANDIKVVEKAFTVSDVKYAAEAFITSTSANVLPLVRLDDIVIGKGKPGPVTQKLMALYNAHILAQTGKIFE